LPDSEPDLLNFPEKSVWREVYQGRWRELQRVQKAEFLIEVLFGLAITGGLAYVLYFREGSISGETIAFGVVIAILVAFFFVLRLFIR
jgi:hypothetical protein